MKKSHLSSEDLDALLHQDPAAPSTHASQHLAACPDCAAELRVLRNLLGEFRSTATAYANWEQQFVTPRVVAAKTHRRWQITAAFLPVTAALAVAIFVLPAHRTPAVRPSATTASVSADDKFMQSIDADLEASTPDALAPLAQTSVSTTASRKASAF